MLLARSKFEHDKREAILHFEHILETLAVIPTVAVEILDHNAAPKSSIIGGIGCGSGNTNNNTPTVGSPNNSNNNLTLLAPASPSRPGSSSSGAGTAVGHPSNNPSIASSPKNLTSPAERVEAMYVCTTNECLYNLSLTYYALGEYDKAR
jgi:hypothetical protein